MRKKIVCLLILVCFCGLCNAQQVVSSGGYVVKSAFSVNWILGGSLLDILAGDLTPGNKPQNEQLIGSDVSLRVYPLPASDFINVEITPVTTDRIIYELINVSGIKVLQKDVASQPLIKVDLQDIPSGVYYFKVVSPSSQDQLFKVEKIIKN